MNHRTDELSKEEERMKRTTGRNMAITGMTILISDLLMLFVSSMLYQRGTLGFDGVLISTVALMSSFGPVTHLQILAVPCRIRLQPETVYWIFWKKSRW